MTPTALGAEPTDARPILTSLWLAVRKHWPLTMLLTAVVSAGVAFYTLGLTKIYEASATIIFDPNVPRPLGDKQSGVMSDASSYWNNKEYYRTQVWVIQSMRVASQVVRDLELNKDATFLANLPQSSKHPRANATVEQAAQALISRLTVDPMKDTRLTTVKYRDADPARAQRILGALVDTYAQDNLDDVFESATVAADWLRGQVGNLRESLESSEMALHEYKKQKNILSVSMDDQSNMLRGEMTQLNQAVTEVRTRRERVLSRLTELRKIQPEDPGDLPARELIESPTLQALRAQYVEASRDLNSLLGEGRGENHPLVKAAQARLNVVRDALFAEIKNILDSYERDLAALDKEAAGLEGLFKQAEKQALDLNLMEIEYNRLLRAKENNEKLFGIVIERSKETDLSRMLRVNNVRVLDRPLRPTTPVTPNVPLNIAGGIAAGLMLGLIAAIGREQLDRTIKMPDDVERELNLPLLGILPRLAETGPGDKAAGGRRRRSRGRDVKLGNGQAVELFAHHFPASGVAEAARAIRTNVMFMSPDNPLRTLLVTSAAPSEGKTTVACAIATTIAQAGQRVVLIDCDLRQPRLHRIFKQSNDVGVTTALLDPTTEDSIAVETEVPNLWMVPTGPIPPNPAEILHSESFKKLLLKMRDRFDRVIIDSPPIVPVTDATVLSKQVDGVIVVVRASRTTKELIRRALKSLRDVSSRLVGVVLNAADIDGGNYAGYQYYYYRRGGYGVPPQQTLSKDSGDHVGTA